MGNDAGEAAEQLICHPERSKELFGQALCFFAGANPIFFGDKLLTAKNPGVDIDLALLHELGLNVETVNRARDLELTSETAAS